MRLPIPPSHFRAEDGSLDGSRCVFVVGAPRSGTTWLHRMVAAHPRVASIEGELTIFSRYLAPAKKSFDREYGHMVRGEWSQGLPLLFSPAEFDAGLREIVESIYSRVLARFPDATHLLDKHPDYCHHLQLIERLVPDARFIHIIRDGREVAVSMISAKRRLGYGAGEVEAASREWRSSVQDARVFGETIGSRYLEVRYEDLVKGTTSVLDRVYRHVGLEMSEEELARIAEEHHISRKQVSRGDMTLNDLRSEPDAIWRSRLGLKERYIMNRIAGPLLMELGYARSGWWALNPVHRLWMLPYPLYLKSKRSLQALLAIWKRPVFRA